MLRGQLETIRSALDALAAVDDDDVDEAELHDAVIVFGELSSRFEARWCRLIGAWDRRQLWAQNGSKSPGARLARETHRRRGECDRLMHRARDLQAMPATAAAYASGELSGNHVDLIASCNREWRNADFSESEQFLVDLCRSPSFRVAYQGVEYWKQLADRDAADRDADALRDSRHLSASISWRGTLVIDGVLDPLGREILSPELHRITEAPRPQDQRDGAPRTATQRRAAALVEMPVRSAAAPADGLRPRPLLTVTIGIDPFSHLCHTASGTVIAPG